MKHWVGFLLIGCGRNFSTAESSDSGIDQVVTVTTSTGGASTGGASTGGASTGGASTGGASTGGAFTGGAFTGGASTGGASTGGTISTGGVVTVTTGGRSTIIDSGKIPEQDAKPDVKSCWVPGCSDCKFEPYVSYPCCSEIDGLCKCTGPNWTCR